MRWIALNSAKTSQIQGIKNETLNLPLSLILTAIFIMPIMIESVQALSEINGWISPTESGDHNKYVGYGIHYEPGGIPSVHLGQDFEGNTGDPVYAIAGTEKSLNQEQM